MRFNQWQFSGNLGADPEQRFTQDGRSVWGMRVAVNVGRKQGDEWIDNTIWVRVTAIGDRFAWIGERLAKGDSVFIQGKLDISTYEHKETHETRYSVDVLANDVQQLFRKPSDGESNGSYGGDRWGTGARPAPAAAASAPRARQAPKQAEREDLEDLPF